MTAGPLGDRRVLDAPRRDDWDHVDLPEPAAPIPRPHPHPSIAVYAEAVEEAMHGMPVLSLNHRTGIYTVGGVPMTSQPHWLLRQPSTPLVQSTLDGLPYTPQPVLT